MTRPSDSVSWPRLLSILAAINPVLLLVVGVVLNRGIDSAKLQIEQNKAQIQDLKTAAETSSINARIQVDKVKVIQDFLGALSGPNETRRQIAIQAIFIVLPEEAPRLVKVIEEQKADGRRTKDAATATAALSQTRSRLITDMFSEARPTRVDALRSLQRGWTDDATVIGQLIDRAMQDVEARKSSEWRPPATPQATQQLSSISNTAEFLTTAIISDPKLREKAVNFAAAAAPNSDDTRRFAKLIKDRFPR